MKFKILRNLLLLIGLMLFATDVMATHLVGGVIYYECLGGSDYRIIVIRYRDPNGVPLSNAFDVVVDDRGNNSLNDTLTVTRTSVVTISATPVNPCHVPSNFQYEEHTFESPTFTLSANPGGYDIYNISTDAFGNTIVGDNARPPNILNILGSNNVGQTLQARIPDPGVYPCNSSPTFNNIPAIELCVNDTINYDYSATDPDGDNVTYFLCDALDSENYFPNQFPPHPVVPYAAPYSGTFPMNANPALAIDPNTGILTGKPTQQGTYVLTICMDEERSGNTIGRYRREIQLNVVVCDAQTSAEITGNASTPGIILSCDDFTVDFVNGTTDTTSETSYHWDFGVSGVSTDTSTKYEPSFTYPTSGTYQVTLVTNPAYPSCSDTATATVRVFPVMETDFGATEPFCVGNPIQFIDSSSQTNGSIVFWNWNFGDPPSGGSNTSINKNPTHTYNTPGTYQVTLFSSSDKGCENSDTMSIVVSPSPALSIPSQVSLCQGDSAVIDITTDGNSFDWTPKTEIDCDTCEDPTVWPSQNRPYFVTVTNAAGCTSNGQALVIRRDTPTVDAGPTKFLCSSAVQLEGSATNVQGFPTFQWTPAAGLSNPSAPKPMATPNQTTTYTLTVTTSFGCAGSDTVTVFTSNISVTASANDYELCPGDSTIIIANSNISGVTYDWSPGTGLSDSTISNPVAKPSDTTVYTIEVTNPTSGCISQDTVIVRINTPVGIDAGPDTSICVNESVTLNPIGGINYLWDSDPALSCTNCESPTATPLTTTEFKVSAIDSVGCPVRDSLTVTVNPLPSISTSGDETICEGTSTTLNANGGQTYIWSPSASLSCDTCQSPIASPAASTVYSVTVIDGNNCVNDTTVEITVSPPPTVTTIADQEVCEGESVQISASGGITYQWSPGGTLSNRNIADPVASPAVNTMYTVTVTDANGCTSVDSVLVQVNTLQLDNFVSDTAICRGESVELFADGFVNYAWGPSSSLSCSGCSNPIATPTVTTNYTVEVIDGNGCIDTGDVTVTVNQLPFITTSSDTYVCIGDSTQLNANSSGAQQYVWTPSTGLSDDSTQNPWAKPTSTTDFTVEVTDGNGCKNTESVNVEVKPLPTITMSQDKVICEGDTTHLFASGGDVYSWSPGSSLSCTTCPDPIAQPQDDETFTVMVTDGFGCTNVDSVFINVNKLDPGAFVQDTAICIGESVELFANGFQTYNWWPGSDLSCTTCPSPLATPPSAGSFEYFVGVRDANGCEDTNSVVITVNPLPTATAVAADDSICIGSSTQLTATGGVEYQWTPSLSLSEDSISTPIASPTNDITYTVTVTDGNGCENTATEEITVLPLPTISKSNDTYVCKYDSTQLSVSGGISYNWSPSNTLSCNSCTDPFAFPLSTTIYTVEVTDQYGCVNEDSITISVNEAAGNISNDTAICIGERTQLEISGGVSYTWWPATDLSCTGCETPVAAPTTSTTYNVEVIDNNGCKDTAEVTVTVNPLPTVNTTGDEEICNEDTINIGANANGASIFQWTPVAGLGSPNSASTSAYPSTSTNYTVEVTDVNGCTDTSQLFITVNPLPNTDAGSDQVICRLDSTTLNGSGANAYQWSPPSGLSCTDCATPKASPSSTTLYTLTGTHQNGCTKEDYVTVTVNDLPNISVSNDELICIGDTVSLSANGGINYEWSPAVGLSCTNCADPIAIPDSTTTYTVRGYNNFNCFEEQQVTITVNSPASIQVTSDTIVCPGESVQLNASGGVSYEWSPSQGLSDPNIASPLATPPSSTTYSLKVTDASGCEIDEQVEVDLFVPADPNASVDTNEICYGDTVILSAENGVSYSWAPGVSIFSPGQSSSIATPEETTNYEVSIVDINGCENSDEVLVTVHPLPPVSAGLDQSIYEGGRARLEATGASIYIWTPNVFINDTSLANPIVYPEDTFRYYLTGIDQYGCINYDSVDVYVLPEADFDLPTAFTPNGDGINDEFRIQNAENFNLISLQVFDRWGLMVFETSNISEPWDGRLNGKVLPIGTYVYVLKGDDDLGKAIMRTGNITLLR